MKLKFELQLYPDNKTIVDKDFVPASHQSEFESVVEQIAMALMACGYPEELVKDYIKYD